MNTTNTSVCFEAHRLFKASIVIIFASFGVIGNIFIIILALKYTVKKNLHHLIINMAAADGMVSVMKGLYIVPNLVGQDLFDVESQILKDFMCKSLGFFYDVFKYVSLVTLLKISVERYRATSSTVKISQPHSLKSRLAVIIGAWLLSTILHVYILIYPKHVSGICLYPWEALVYFGISHCCTAITFTTAVILSILSLRNLSKRRAIENHLPERSRNARQKRIARVVRMVLWSLALYSTNLPLMIFKLLELLTLSKVHNIVTVNCLYTISSYILNTLPLVNTCLSPFLYVMFLQDFREAASKVFYVESCFKSRKNRIYQQQNDGQEMGEENNGMKLAETPQVEGWDTKL